MKPKKNGAKKSVKSPRGRKNASSDLLKSKYFCDSIVKNMKQCSVVLDRFPGLDKNTKGKILLFPCSQCNRFFSSGFLYSQHVSTHPDSEFCHLKTILLNINNPFSKVSTDDSQALKGNVGNGSNDVDKDPSLASNSPVMSSSKRKIQNKNRKCSECLSPSDTLKQHTCIKSCVVALNTFSGLDRDTRGVLEFFQCPRCRRYFLEGFSCCRHSNQSESILLSINKSYETLNGTNMQMKTGEGIVKNDNTNREQSWKNRFVCNLS